MRAEAKAIPTRFRFLVDAMGAFFARLGLAFLAVVAALSVSANIRTPAFFASRLDDSMLADAFSTTRFACIPKIALRYKIFTLAKANFI